jgi:hypothetical protein
MKSELRPLTSNEQRQLKSLVRYRPGGIDDFLVNWLIGGGFVTLIVVFLVSKISFFFPYLFQIAIACGLLTAVAAYYFARKHRQSASSNARLNIIKDLSEGLAEICTFEVSEAIAVEEFEDEGTGFYLKVGTKQVLFVVGQYLDDLAAKNKFPSTVVQLVRSPKAQIPLGLTPLGTYLSPIGMRPPFTKEEFKRELVPREGDIFEIDFESLKRESRKKP